MAIPSKQIGWSQEANLYYELLKQLNRLTAVMSKVTLEPGTTTTTTTVVLPIAPICGLDWTTVNLDVTTYRNGDPIPEVTDFVQWRNLTTGAWCWYNNDPALGAVYGKLYNWYAVNDPRGLAPNGYRITTTEDYLALIDCLGPTVGDQLKEAGTVHWAAPNTGTNTTGFTALPGGVRGAVFSSNFENITTGANFWTSSESSPTQAIGYRMFNNGPSFSRGFILKTSGRSVRLVKE